MIAKRGGLICGQGAQALRNTNFTRVGSGEFIERRQCRDLVTLRERGVIEHGVDEIIELAAVGDELLLIARSSYNLRARSLFLSRSYARRPMATSMIPVPWSLNKVICRSSVRPGVSPRSRLEISWTRSQEII